MSFLSCSATILLPIDFYVVKLKFSKHIYHFKFIQKLDQIKKA